MTLRKRALVWRLVVPVAIARLPLSLGAQNGGRTPDDILKQETTQDEYDRPDRTFNKNSFTSFGARSMEYFTRLGYAVIDPDTPIVGPQGQMNNNYVNDLRNDLSATIDELDRRQIVEKYVKNPRKADPAKKITTDQPMTVR